MPKESAHLYLAGKAAASVKNSVRMPEISAALEYAPNLFMAGSVAPDSIFNYLSGDARTYFSRLLKYSHDCRSHHLFSFLNRFAEMNLPLASALSFGLGAVCHLSADMIFHPPIFYFTGSEAEGRTEAMIRHFCFESAMDRYLRWLYPQLKKTRLRTYFRQKEMPDPDFAAALEAIHVPPENTGEAPPVEFISMYKQHAAHESYYGKRLFHRLSQILAALPGGSVELPALLYTDIPGKAAEKDRIGFLEKTIEFRNPVSGAVLNKNFAELERDFTELFLDYLTPLEQALRRSGGLAGKDWTELITAVKGLIPRDPESGLPCMPGAAGETVHSMSFSRLESFEEVWMQ